VTLLGRPVVLGRSTAASTGHWLASEAAIGIMRAGGNAIDGAVAALAVLAVVKPDACALGSDLFLQVFDAKPGSVHALNASGPAAELANVEAYGREISHRGPRAVAVMGAVGGWEAALQRFGTLDLARALAPAIGYARDGFPVSLHLAAAFEGGRALLASDPGCAAVFLRGGHVPQYGELFRQPELADTLAAIASGGAKAFYAGAFGRALDADMRARGGFLRAGDLAAYAPEWKESLRVRYRGYDVFEQPLISQGIIVLEAAKLLEGFPLQQYGDRSADFVHLHTEAVKLAVADRQRYCGDPAFLECPIEALLNDDFIAERRAAIDPQRANANPRYGALLEAAADTSYGCTVDAQGNGVSFIQSIYEVWGSAYLVPGTGTLCNNRMTGFSLDPSHPNVLAPGKRTMHTLNTVVVCKDGKLRWLFGTPGAPAQVQSNTQLLTRVIDFGLNPQAAIEAPRAFWPQGAELMVEDPFGAAAFDELRRRGHQVVDLGPRHAIVGGMEMIHVNEHGVREAGADPRREGYAIAY
jgi:gamma-glutamyltranspeptidase / glutathione hydrolase